MPSFLRHPALRHYLLGLGAVVLGAGFTAHTGSMLPLALGSAAAVMTTASFVQAWRARAAVRREARARGRSGRGPGRP